MEVSNEEIGKYKKKKNSGASKSNKKSKHKHIYEECLFSTKFYSTLEDCILHGSYCTICGKISKRGYRLREVVKTGEHSTRFMTNEEVLEKYKGLPIIHLDDYFQKYAPVSKEDGE